MLIINEELLAIDEAIENLVASFLNLPEVADFKEKKKQFEEDGEIQCALADFQALKESYEQEELYASYRPDVKAKKRQLLTLKRQLDVNPLVSHYRQAETALQAILAQLSQDLSQAISEQIFVDTGLPLAPHKPRHQHGQGNNIKEKINGN